MILVAGHARTELQKSGQEVVTRVSTWCVKKKLSLSAKKTEMLLVKGKLDAERPPIMKINGKSVKMCQRVSKSVNPGVHSESDLKINRHVDEMSAKNNARGGAIPTATDAGIAAGIVQARLRSASDTSRSTRQDSPLW